MLFMWLALVLLPVFGGAERFNCKGRILGAYYADAKSGCKAFHVCVRVAGGGIRDFRFFCPPGTLFHQEAQTCTDWGDDDPLACPAEIYDGQFDLYKIGSGLDMRLDNPDTPQSTITDVSITPPPFSPLTPLVDKLRKNVQDNKKSYDTKKLSSPVNRDEESEFGLQRAETGDRRSSQNNAASDLRAAHSSDFFSGQRDRGRDDSAPPPPRGPISQSNQQNVPQQLSPQQHASHQAPQQHASHQAPQQPQYQQPSSQQPASHAPRQSFRRPTTARPTSPTTQHTNPPSPPTPQPSSPPQYESTKRKLVRKRPIYVSQSTPAPQTTFAQNTLAPQSLPEQAPQQQQNYNRRVPQPKQTIPPVNVPPQYKEYKDEYVEVSRVTPKPNKYFQAKSSTPFPQSTPAPNFNNKKNDGLVELYNYDTQSTPGLSQNDNRPFKVRNGFSVSDAPREQDYQRLKNVNTNRVLPSTVEYNPPSRATSSSPSFNNYNSVSYEPEKNNFVQYSKQNYISNPTTTPSTTTFYTTTFRPDPPHNLNTVAYNTNIGFGNTLQSNYGDFDEDDGQYRPPQGEDDGQYRPELYERELLSGAHSLNIAASGNRLPEDQKPRGKTQAPFKTASQTTYKQAPQASFQPPSQQPQYKPVSQTAAPRPFRPAPTPSSPAPQRVSETFPTTIRPQTQPQTQRTFDYYQTYTTTSRPNHSETSVAPAPSSFDTGNNNQAKSTTTLAPRTPEPQKQQHRAPPPPTARPLQTQRPTTRLPVFANPANNKEDASYDYAYYDSDPGFSEYDHIEEFGKTKSKKA